MNFDPNTITAWAAMATALVAIIASMIDNKRARQTLEVELLLKLNDIFMSPEFIRKRRKAASFIAKSKPDVTKWTCQELDDVLDFFQMTASFTSKGHIGEKILGDFFYYWLNGYYSLTNRYIKHHDVWSDLEWLHRRLTKEDSKLTGNPYTPLTRKEIKKFLDYESNLKI